MGFSIYSLAVATVLILNALAIISERRVLARLGMAPGAAFSGRPNIASPNTADAFVPSFELDDAPHGGPGIGGPPPTGLRLQLANFLSSIRMLMRWPLIAVNMVLIIAALVFG